METQSPNTEQNSLIELRVEDVLPSPQTTDAFSLILRELREEQDEQGTHRVPTQRYISIIIGQSEARAILVELNKLPTHRPLTHELFHTLSLHTRCDLLMVNIIHFENGVYYAEIGPEADKIAYIAPPVGCHRISSEVGGDDPHPLRHF